MAKVDVLIVGAGTAGEYAAGTASSTPIQLPWLRKDRLVVTAYFMPAFLPRL